jgi:hypothetical protein
VFGRRGPAEPQAATLGEEEQHGRQRAGDHSKGQPPARDQLPDRQRKEVKAQGLPENRVRWAALGRGMRVEGETGPMIHHAATGEHRHEQRQAQGDQPQQRLQRQPYRLPIDVDRVADQRGKPAGLQCADHPIEHREGEHGEHDEGQALQVETSPENGAIAQRVEPERIDVIGQGQAEGDECDARHPKPGQESAPALTCRGVAGQAAQVAIHEVLMAGYDTLQAVKV